MNRQELIAALKVAKKDKLTMIDLRSNLTVLQTEYDRLFPTAIACETETETAIDTDETEYQFLCEKRDRLESEIKTSKENLDTILDEYNVKRLPNGLTPDCIKEKPEYRKEKTVSKSLFSALQETNKTLVKRFGEKLKRDRDLKRKKPTIAETETETAIAKTETKTETETEIDYPDYWVRKAISEKYNAKLRSVEKPKKYHDGYDALVIGLGYKFISFDEIPPIQKSKNHAFFIEQDQSLYEYIIEGDLIYKAPISNAIALDTGNRHARYDSQLSVLLNYPDSFPDG